MQLGLCWLLLCNLGSLVSWVAPTCTCFLRTWVHSKTLRPTTSFSVSVSVCCSCWASVWEHLHLPQPWLGLPSSAKFQITRLARQIYKLQRGNAKINKTHTLAVEVRDYANTLYAECFEKHGINTIAIETVHVISIILNPSMLDLRSCYSADLQLCICSRCAPIQGIYSIYIVLYVLFPYT